MMSETSVAIKNSVSGSDVVKTITSMEIAEMMEMEHYEVLKKLEGDKQI